MAQVLFCPLAFHTSTNLHLLLCRSCHYRWLSSGNTDFGCAHKSKYRLIVIFKKYFVVTIQLAGLSALPKTLPLDEFCQFQHGCVLIDPRRSQHNPLQLHIDRALALSEEGRMTGLDSNTDLSVTFYLTETFKGCSFECHLK